jgi:hypothetical protein
VGGHRDHDAEVELAAAKEQGRRDGALEQPDLRGREGRVCRAPGSLARGERYESEARTRAVRADTAVSGNVPCAESAAIYHVQQTQQSAVCGQTRQSASMYQV